MDGNIQLDQGVYYIIYKDGGVITKGIADGSMKISTANTLVYYTTEDEYNAKLATLTEKEDEYDY